MRQSARWQQRHSDLAEQEYSCPGRNAVNFLPSIASVGCEQSLILLLDTWDGIWPSCHRIDINKSGNSKSQRQIPQKGGGGPGIFQQISGPADNYLTDVNIMGVESWVVRKVLRLFRWWSWVLRTAGTAELSAQSHLRRYGDLRSRKFTLKEGELQQPQEANSGDREQTQRNNVSQSTRNNLDDNTGCWCRNKFFWIHKRPFSEWSPDALAHWSQEMSFSVLNSGPLWLLWHHCTSVCFKPLQALSTVTVMSIMMQVQRGRTNLQILLQITIVHSHFITGWNSPGPSLHQQGSCLHPDHTHGWVSSQDNWPMQGPVLSGAGAHTTSRLYFDACT